MAFAEHIPNLNKSSSYLDYEREVWACLEAEGGSEDFLRKFYILDSDSQKVEFMRETVRMYNLNSDQFSRDLKSDAKAKEYRAIGNAVFKRHDYIGALKYFTQMIMHAKIRKVNEHDVLDLLASGYARRSAALFELGLYAECLVDIERALAAGYPENQRSSLESRRDKALNMQADYAPPRFPHCIPTPVIPKKRRHKTFPCANRNVKVKITKSQRRLFASQQLDVGDVLVVENPVLFDVAEGDLYHCHNCCALCYNPIPCEDCCQVLYCKELCRHLAGVVFHRYECALLKSLKYIVGGYKPFLLAIRMMFRPQQYVNPTEVAGMLQNMPWEARGPQVFSMSMVCALVYDILKDNQTEFLTTTKRQKRFKEDLMLNLRMAATYTSGISEAVPVTEDWLGENVIRLTQPMKDVASGIYPFSSYIGHGCNVNAVVHHHGMTRVVRAVRTIQPNEEIVVTYGPYYPVHTKAERTAILRTHFHVNCWCRACRSDWPTLDRTPWLLTDDNIIALMRTMRYANIEACERVIPWIKRQVRRKQWDEPDQCLLLVHKILCLVYTLLGNRRHIR